MTLLKKNLLHPDAAVDAVDVAAAAEATAVMAVAATEDAVAEDAETKSFQLTAAMILSAFPDFEESDTSMERSAMSL